MKIDLKEMIRQDVERIKRDAAVNEYQQKQKEARIKEMIKQDEERMKRDAAAAAAAKEYRQKQNKLADESKDLVVTRAATSGIVSAVSSVAQGVTSGVLGLSSGINNAAARIFLNTVNESYEDLMRVLFTRTGEFIDEMGRYWAAPVAREFFTRIFIPKINEMITYCHTTMSTVNSTVNNASTTWAKHNKATWSNVSFAASSKKQLDGAASAIKDSINDVQGIDKANAISAMSKFRNYKKDINDAINKVTSAANKAGFLGGNQNSNLVNAMKKLATKLTNAMEEITLAMEKAINQTVEKYEDKEGKISSSFEEFGSGISEFVSGAIEAVATLFDFS